MKTETLHIRGRLCAVSDTAQSVKPCLIFRGHKSRRGGSGCAFVSLVVPIFNVLSAALTQIATSVSNIPTGENVDAKISAAIDELIGALLFQFSTSSAVIAGSASSFALSAAVKSSADKPLPSSLSTLSIKVDNEFKALIAKSDGENVAVTYKGAEMTLSAALTSFRRIPCRQALP